MKKQLLSILAIISAYVTYGQSIPNGGFEQWQSYNYENPQYFQTSNYGDEHGGLVNYANVQKVNTAYHGQHAALLETVTYYGSNGSLDTAFGFIANGNPGGNNASEGIPINQKPTGVRFYYEYYSAYSNNSPTATPDSGLAIFEFKKSGSLIASYICHLLPTNSSPGYVLFNQTFSLSATPDTVLVAFASSSNVINNGKGQPGSSLYLDSIRFTGVSSQPAMLNGDLENWLPQTKDILLGWPRSYNYVRTNDRYSGNYAIQLTTMQPLMSQLNTGEISLQQDHNYGPPTGGFPYATQADTLVFYYKYYPANYPSSTDTAAVQVSLYKNGSPVGGAYKVLNYCNNYKKVEVPFNGSQIPDTLAIDFRSSKNWPVQQSFNGSSLYIDEVYLKSQKIPSAYFGGFNIDGCVGDTIQLRDLSQNAPNSWQWFMTGAHPSGTSTQQNPKIYYTSPGTYSISLQACDSFGCSSFYTRTVNIHALPQIQATSATICANTSATLTVSNTLLTADSAASPYFWSDATGIIANGVTTVLSPSTTTTYTVLGTSQYGCKNTATTSITLLQAPVPDICLVTVDSLSQYNVIYWDKTSYTNVDSFIAYREVQTAPSIYKRIGSQPYSALSQFIDTARHIGPSNGDPNGGSYRYKLQTVDTCGNYSVLGPYHNTVFIQHNSSGVFSWVTPYSIENQSSPVVNYILFCDTANTNTWTSIQSVAGNQNQVADPGYNNHSSIANWRVDATGFNCNPTYKLAGGTNNTLAARVKSHSNQNNNRVAGIKNLASASQINVYPNPATNVINIGTSSSSSKVTVKIYSLIGSEVLSSNNKLIDISSLANGTYVIQVTTDNITEIKRIVKN